MALSCIPEVPTHCLHDNALHGAGGARGWPHYALAHRESARRTEASLPVNPPPFSNSFLFRACTRLPSTFVAFKAQIVVTYGDPPHLKLAHSKAPGYRMPRCARPRRARASRSPTPGSYCDVQPSRARAAALNRACGQSICAAPRSC